MSRQRQPGEPVVVRDVYRSRIRSIVPMLVVDHVADRVVLFLKPGTPFCLPVDRNGRLTKDVVDFDRLAELTWHGPEQLVIASLVDSHAIIARWDATPSRRLSEWYVNLQAPLVPTSIGWDTTDYALDVVLSPDLQTMRWKDEAQLAGLVRCGQFTAVEAAGFRQEGERVVAAARAGGRPFSEGWDRWTPDPNWPTPSLPSDWQAQNR